MLLRRGLPLQLFEPLRLGVALFLPQAQSCHAAIQFIQLDEPVLVSIDETRLFLFGGLALALDASTLPGEDGGIGRNGRPAGDGLLEQIGMAEQAAEVGPDQFVKLLGTQMGSGAGG